MSSTSRWQREEKRRIGNGPLDSYTTAVSFKLVTYSFKGFLRPRRLSKEAFKERTCSLLLISELRVRDMMFEEVEE